MYIFMTMKSLRRELGDKISPKKADFLKTIEPLMQADRGLNLTTTIMKDLPEHFIDVLAAYLPPGTIVKFDSEDTSASIEIFFKGVLGKRTLILDKHAASIIAQYMWNTKYEVILRIEDGAIIESTLVNIVNRLRDSTLELSSKIPIATVEKLAQIMSERRSTLFLDEDSTKDTILAASHHMQCGGVLELSTNLPLNILIQVAERLNPGVMLQLRNTTISSENIKLLAASLKPSCGLKLKSEMSERIVAAATALKPGVILQLESDQNTTNISNGIQALQPGSILMLTKYSGSKLFQYSAEFCPIGVKIMLAPNCIQDYFIKVAQEIKAGRHLYIARGTCKERVDSVYSHTKEGVIIEDYTGDTPKIIIKGKVPQPVLTAPEAPPIMPAHGFRTSSAMDVRPDSMVESGLACGIQGSNPMDYAPGLRVDQPELSKQKSEKLALTDRFDSPAFNRLPDAQEGAPQKKTCLGKPSRREVKHKLKSSKAPQWMAGHSENTFFSKEPSSPEVASQRKLPVGQTPLGQLLNAVNRDRELNLSASPKRSISENTSEAISCLLFLSCPAQKEEAMPPASDSPMGFPEEIVGSLSVEEEITQVNQDANRLPFA